MKTLALIGFLLLAWVGTAHAQNPGIQPQGVINPGDCLQSGTTRFFASSSGAGCGGGGGGGTPGGSTDAVQYNAGGGNFGGITPLTNGQLVVGQTSAAPLGKTVSGDATLAASGALTVTHVDGVAYPASPSTNTVPVVTGANTVTYEAVPNAALANASTTVNGQTCTLGSTCSISVGTGTVTTVSVVTANGVSGSVANPTTTPAITLTLGAITPTSVHASTTVDADGALLSGTNGGNAGALGLFGSSTGEAIIQAPAAAGSVTLTTPSASGTLAASATSPITLGSTTGTIACATCGVTGSPLSQFASTTSAQLAGVLSDETGTGVSVFGTAPTLSNPIVGTQSASDNTTKAASTAYVTGAIATAIAGVNPAVAVSAATTSAANTASLTYANGAGGIGATFTGTTNVAITVDGFTFSALGQRLLVKNDTQSPSGAFNGVYYVTQVQTALLPPILTRALDYDQPSDINSTGAIPVVSGTVNGSTSWLLTSTINTVGTDALTYIQFSLNPTTIATSSNNLSFFASTTSSQLASVISDETGTGALVFAASPTLSGTLGPGAQITVTSQSGTTYTLASSDCFSYVRFSNAGAVTVTIPATLPAGCQIAMEQDGAGQVTVTGTAVAAATLHSAHSYTKTFGQYATIGITINANSGGSAAIAILTGDGA